MAALVAIVVPWLVLLDARVADELAIITALVVIVNDVRRSVAALGNRAPQGSQ